MFNSNIYPSLITNIHFSDRPVYTTCSAPWSFTAFWDGIKLTVVGILPKDFSTKETMCGTAVQCSCDARQLKTALPPIPPSKGGAAIDCKNGEQLRPTNTPAHPIGSNWLLTLGERWRCFNSEQWKRMAAEHFLQDSKRDDKSRKFEKGQIFNVNQQRGIPA